MSLKRWRKGIPTGKRSEKRARADLDRFEKELTEARESADAQKIATALNNIGTVYTDLKDFEKARQYYQEAVDSLDETCPGEDWVTAHGNLATVCRLQEDWAGAIEHTLLAEGYARTRNSGGDVEYLAIAMGLVRKAVGLERFRELFQQELSSLPEELRAAIDTERHLNPTFRKQEKKPKRNDPCPCGSGKKYKKCCGVDE